MWCDAMPDAIRYDTKQKPNENYDKMQEAFSVHFSRKNHPIFASISKLAPSLKTHLKRNEKLKTEENERIRMRTEQSGTG